MPIYPIQFAIPETLIVPEVPLDKKQAFAHVDPRNRSTYIYHTETEYYKHYSESYYAVTQKKGGWDCFRHYEILAAGCIPYFIGIEDLPPQTMTAFPSALIKEAMRLPGVTCGSIDFDVFNKIRYFNILQALLEYTRQHLTCRALAERFISTVSANCGVAVRTVLFLSDDPSPDYQKDLLLIGMKQILGENCTLCLKIPHVFDSFPVDQTHKLYGRGFGYVRHLKEQLEVIFAHYDLVVHGSMHRENTDRLFQAFMENGPTYGTSVFVCGEDIGTCSHAQNCEPVLFLRESDNSMNGKIHAKYNELLMVNTDIQEHLPFLASLAEECAVVSDFGMAGTVAASSPWAFLYGLAKNKTAHDKAIYCVDQQPALLFDEFRQVAAECSVQAFFYQTNSLSAAFERRVDMMFINTWNVYGQLRRELAVHADYVNKYIVIAGTCVDAIDGESVRKGMDAPGQARERGWPDSDTTTGTDRAVQEFLDTWPRTWRMFRDFKQCNGLIVLKRV